MSINEGDDRRGIIKKNMVDMGVIIGIKTVHAYHNRISVLMISTSHLAKHSNVSESLDLLFWLD